MLLTVPIILAILTALAEFFRFLCTAEGQKIAAQWAADAEKLRRDMAEAWKRIEVLFPSQSHAEDGRARKVDK